MINFVTALHAEAKPIIDQLRLKKSQAWQPFPVYASREYRLIISGIGRCNSAAATSWLASLAPLSNALADETWLNVGIAGHKDQPLGKLMCCHKITEQSTSKSWYPVQIKSSLESSDLLTVDQVSTDYSENLLQDMEASGFYLSALRFTTSELAQCLKIVSDNVQNPIENITQELVYDLINQNLADIKAVAECLQDYSIDNLPPDISHLEEFILNTCKFSVTQTRQLQRLLHRYYVVVGTPDTLLDDLQSTTINRASLVLEFIQNDLNQRSVEIS